MPVSDSTFQAFIENEAGSRTKNVYDETTFRLLRRETVARSYPYPYGFVLNTASGDGDGVDCFVVTDRALNSGDIVECTPLHLLEQIEDGEIDHKVLCVLADSPRVVEDHAVATIRAFVLAVFSHIPGKRMQLGALLGTAEAVRYMRQCSA